MQRPGEVQLLNRKNQLARRTQSAAIGVEAPGSYDSATAGQLARPANLGARDANHTNRTDRIGRSGLGNSQISQMI